MFDFWFKKSLSLKTISAESNAFTNEMTAPCTETTLPTIPNTQNIS